MKLLGGGPKEWALPAVLTAAIVALPLLAAMAITHKHLTNAEVVLGIFFGELVGVAVGAAVNAILAAHKPWHLNTISAVFALAGGLLMTLTL